MSETTIIVLTVFILKLLDCTFNTMKSIYLYKNKYALSAALNTVSNVFYLIAIVQIARSSDGWPGIAAVAIATYIGTWLPAVFMHKLEPDQMFIYEITSDNMDNGKKFADILISHNIPVRTSKTYSKRHKALCIKAFSDSKCTSKLIESGIPSNFKWIIYCPKSAE